MAIGSGHLYLRRAEGVVQLPNPSKDVCQVDQGDNLSAKYVGGKDDGII